MVECVPQTDLCVFFYFYFFIFCVAIYEQPTFLLGKEKSKVSDLLSFSSLVYSQASPTALSASLHLLLQLETRGFEVLFKAACVALTTSLFRCTLLSTVELRLWCLFGLMKLYS